MHVVRRDAASGIAHYDLVLHDTTFGEAAQHPGNARQRFAHDPSPAVYQRLEGEALDRLAEHFHAYNDYPSGTVHLAAQQLTSEQVWERTLDTNNGRKQAKKVIATMAAVGGVAMLVVPGGSVVSAGLMVVSSAAGVASVALELEHRLATQRHLKLDRRLMLDVLQVVAISLPFGTLGTTFAAASKIAKSRFLLCMTALDAAQAFLITSDARAQIELIDANTAVELAGAASDERRAQLHAERDRRVAEVIGGAVVNGGFLLVSLGHGIKNTIAITRTGASFQVREPVRELAAQGRERGQDALVSDTFEHDGGRVQLTAEERRYLEHEVATPEAAPPKPASDANLPAKGHRGSAERRPGQEPTTSGQREAAPAVDEAATPAHARTARPMAAVDHEQLELARIRLGPAGRIRGKSELDNHDVVHSLNAQLKAVKPDGVNEIILGFPAAQRAQARIALAHASGYGNIEALNTVRVALQPHLDAGGKLYVPGSGSLADNLVYSGGKGSYDNVAGAAPGRIAATGEIQPGSVIILDRVVLERIRHDAAFARSIADHHCVLLEPHGFNDGLNLFSAPTPEVIAQRTARLVERAVAIQHQAGPAMPFETAVDTALGEGARAILGAADPRLQAQLQVVHAVDHPDLATASISDQLNGAAGISEPELASGLAGLTVEQQAYARELLARQAEVFSPRRFAAELGEQHQRLLAQAAQRRVSPENVYFYIPEGGKSYGMIAMAHREVTGTPVDHYINGAAELRARALGPDTVLVMFDDVAGSGFSLRDAVGGVSGTPYQGQVIVSPMVSTEQAARLFNEPSSGVTAVNRNVSFQPREITQGLKESAFYRSLGPAEQAKLRDMVGDHGFGGNALSMAFPYMAPDNNNSFFGDLFAKFFIANKNRRAAKSPTYQAPVHSP
jgi:hypothetical protein